VPVCPSISKALRNFQSSEGHSREQDAVVSQEKERKSARRLTQVCPDLPDLATEAASGAPAKVALAAIKGEKMLAELA
jgi:hypothetical protein